MSGYLAPAAARILANLAAGDIAAADAELDSDPRRVAVGMTIVLHPPIGGPE